MKKPIFAVLFTVFMVIALLATSVSADASDKTLTVDASAKEIEGETYTTIQAAIDYINSCADKNGWTITVKSGYYTYFTVNQYIGNLTISSAEGATVDCSSGSIQLMGDTITLDGLTFTATDTAWSVPIIKDASSSAGLYYDSMVTIENCTFQGSNAGCALWICRLNSTIQNCTFDGFSYAIEIINETSTAAKIDSSTITGTITIDGNTVTNCDFFMHYGVRSGITLVVKNNVVVGSPDKVCASLFAWEGKSITVTGNTFVYSAFGLQNAINGVTTKDFLDTNTFYCSYTADDYYNYSTGKDYSVTYYAPEVDWKTVTWSVSSTGVSGDMANYFATALSGHENDNPLTFTTTDGSGDMVCMGLGYQALVLSYASEKVSEPGLDKVIVLEDGTEVDQDDVAAGDTVTFQLTSNVPDALDSYIEYSLDNGNIVGKVGTDAKGNAYTYTLTFHDIMDSSLSLIENTIAVSIVKYTYSRDTNGTVTITKGATDTLDSKYYTVTSSGLSDGCTFEVSLDLLALYTDGIIDEDDFGTAEVVVTYDATLSDNATAGTYYNTAWVSYPDDESEKDKVEVDTYGIKVYKYDMTTYVSLSGATFQLLREATAGDSNKVTIDNQDYVVLKEFTTDSTGYIYFEGLDTGTYYIYESVTPAGYVSSGTVLTVKITDDVNKTTNYASVSVANTPIPETGGKGTVIFTVIGGGLIAAAAAVFVISRKKRVTDAE
ncbi:MAG: right-handed parallel beta-helix repeat-containing protein [Clostridia bacterium]|nr:right-handed parallel beta-helix repeat-containing protein [Clostridia bacterium]